MWLHLQTNLHFTKTLVRSLPGFTYGPGERGLGSLSRVPWVRFTCVSVGRQQGLPVFGQKAVGVKVVHPGDKAVTFGSSTCVWRAHDKYCTVGTMGL